jgi:GNAT acetyltransferase-like protein
MNIGLESINPIEYPGWDNLLLSQPDYSFFHSSHWARVLHDSYGYQPCYFSIIDHQKLSACIPVMDIRSVLTGTRGVSLPFTDYCIPFVPAEISIDDIFQGLVQYGVKSGWRSIEIRGGEKLPQHWPSHSSYYGHTLALHSYEAALFSNVKDSTQRNIRKAQREDVKVTMSSEPDATEEFYRLNCITRKAHGLPPQPIYFFKKIQEHVLSKGHGFIALARHKGNTVAGAVYFHFGKRALYKYGASRPQYLHVRPNDLVMWEAIKWFRSQGYESLCFGRTEQENAGLRAFKIGWGAEERVIRYALYHMKQEKFLPGNPAGRTVSAAILRRMPVSFLKFIGNALYKHVG